MRQGEWADGEWAKGWEAVAGAVWEGLGSRTLAGLRDEVALGGLRPDAGAGWDTRLAVLRRRAVSMARANRVEEALGVLLGEVETAEGRGEMGLADFARWQAIVWEVVRIQAEAR